MKKKKANPPIFFMGQEWVVIDNLYVPEKNSRRVMPDPAKRTT